MAQYEESYSEWSVNEKVAKSVGMNVVADSSFHAVYTGVGDSSIRYAHSE